MIKDFGGPQIHNQPHIFKQQVTLNKAVVGPGYVSSPIWNKLPPAALMEPDYAFTFFDDFVEYTTATRWTTFGDTGVVTAAAGSVITIAPNATTDTHAAGITTTRKCWLPATNKTVFFEARVKFTEAATNEASVFVGMTAGTCASDVPLIDDAGTPTTDDRIALWKVTGTTTTWQCGTSVGATQDDGDSGITRVSGQWTRLGFIADAYRVDFYIDGKLVRSVIDTADLPDALMAITLSVKQGSAAKETLHVDWVKCVTLK